MAGQIKINEDVITELGTKIDPTKDKVFFQNKLVRPQNFVYIMLNKPRGYTCTTKKFLNEKNILDIVAVKEKVFPVGRLDKESQGLIFLTNDGDWAYQMTHPKFQVEKEYAVTVAEPIEKEKLEKMKKGLNDEDQFLKIQSYKINSPVSVNLILTQGHKREIRRLFSHFKCQIQGLKRIRFGNWTLGNLAEGKWQYFQAK